MDMHVKQVLALIEGDESCCEDFPHCEHSTWRAICPDCHKEPLSNNILGPYTCECGRSFYALVDGWVDLRDE